MAEIIYSPDSGVVNTGPISMDVSSDRIDFFVDDYSSVGRTKSGIYFRSAEGYIRNYTKIKSLIVTSIWKPKPDVTNINAINSNA